MHTLVEKLLKALTVDVLWNNSLIPVSPSIGVALFPSRARDYKKLLREADIALYRAKNKGRAQYVIFDSNEKNAEDEREQLKDALPSALANGLLNVAFQPIFPADNTTKVYAIEALTRWEHEGQSVNPIETINLVMELSLDMEFHDWLLKTSFSQLEKYQVENPELKLSINLPANLCHNPKFAQMIISLCDTYHISADKVILEVTETHLMPNPEKAKECLLYLVSANFHVAIDDFGTGFSSMEYIADLPCTILKIDKKFFLELNKNKRNVNIIEAITALAHGLGMRVIAEGIETKDLCASALGLECDLLQGYHLGFPIVPIEGEGLGDFLARSALN
jgi:EAL domain-containing protein (putative c-di-GMP-specific phosphodiesterase class I)